MNTLQRGVITLLFIGATSAIATETKILHEFDNVAECRQNVAALIIMKQSEGWDCNVGNNSATCYKDGVRALVYCDGSKTVLTMEKE